jgi:hypothetical protein
MQSSIKSTISILGLFLSLHAQAVPFSSIDCTHAEEASSQEKLKLKTDKDELKKLAYTATVYSFGQNGQQTDSIEQIPHVAVKLGDAWLAGSNRGEWGGDLVLIDVHGKSEILLNDNIHDIYKTANGVIVLAGLSHLVSNNGRIYLITKNGSSVDYRILFGLDGAPKDSWITNEGEIFINTSYGTSILKTDGTLQRVLCKGQEYYKYNGNH